MKKALIVGLGFIGENLFHQLASDYVVFGTYFSHPPQTETPNIYKLDIRKRWPTLGLIEELRPDIVINAAGVTSVEDCQAKLYDAWYVNCLGTANLLEGCRNVGARFIYPSSSYVFDGEKEGSYREDNERDPINVYGFTKRTAEDLVFAYQDSAVFRFDLCLGYNGEAKRNGFVGKILEPDTVYAENINRRQPIFIGDVVKAIKIAAETGFRGFLHLAGPDIVSTYGLGLELKRGLGVGTVLVPVGEFSSTKRPRNTTLDTGLARSLGIEFTPLSEAIRQIKESIQTTHPEGIFRRRVEG